MDEDARNPPVSYGLGTHYPFAYMYPPTGAPPPMPGYIPPATPVPAPTSNDTGFNEFQWRLLNLCAEFYEAATELIVSTADISDITYSLRCRGEPLMWFYHKHSNS